MARKSTAKKAKKPEHVLGPLEASFGRPSDEEGEGWVQVPNGKVKVVLHEKGNRDGTDMCAVSFHSWHGGDCFNAPVPRGLPYGREGNQVHFKSNCVTNLGYKARHCIVVKFKAAADADTFERLMISITGTENCLEKKPFASTQRKSSRIAAAKSKANADFNTDSFEEVSEMIIREARNDSTRDAKEQLAIKAKASIGHLAAFLPEENDSAVKSELKSRLKVDVDRLLQKKRKEIQEARAKLLSNKKEIMKLHLENVELKLLLEEHFVLDHSFAVTDDGNRTPPKPIELLDSDSEKAEKSIDLLESDLDNNPSEKVNDLVDSSDDDTDDSGDSDDFEEYNQFLGSPIQMSQQNMMKAFTPRKSKH